ncbi:MAG: polysaccharide biosynthesis tyrosine autokinase [Rhodospirillales bacterium]|nr:polysaccharide biosynthesis tyrosine autokinase [Rhodospirillales bacterium]
MDMSLDRPESGRGSAMPHQPARDGMNINAFLRLLWRRKILILATILLSVTSAASYAFLATPRYEADAQLLFEPAANLVAENIATLDREPQDEAAVLSQVGILQSRELAQRVIDKLQLQNVEELNPKEESSGQLFAFLGKTVPWLFAGDAGAAQRDARSTTGQWPPPGADPEQGSRETRVIEAFLSRLNVSPVGRSRVVELKFTAEDPELAATVANTLTEMFLLTRFEHRLQYARQASDWLASHAQQIKADVEQTESTLENYRKEHNLLQGDKVMLLSQQITELNKEIMTASHDRAIAEAELAQAKLVAKSGNIENLNQVLESSLIQRLREEEIGLERAEAEMNERYGPRYPQMLEFKAAKQRFQEKVRSEVNKIIQALEERVQVSRLREQDLDRNLASLKQQVGDANTASVRLRTLERDVEASRLLLEKFMTSFMEMSAQQDVHSQMPQASVISKASAPEHPSFPRKGLVIFLGLVGGTISSFPLAFAAEAMGSGYRSAEDVEFDTGLPVLAHVPKVEGRGLTGRNLAWYCVSKPDSVFTEAIRLLCARLLASTPYDLHQSIVFVSSKAGEGKTTITLAVARALARAGRKVVVVDADFRCGKVAAMLDLRREMGLAELIAGAARLDDVIQQDRGSAVDVIASGAYASESADDLSRECFPVVLQDLHSRYDVVLIDAPPFLALSSASVLAAKADLTIVVAGWSTTPRQVLRYTVEQVQRAAPRVAGVVLNKVNINKNSQYDYGDSSMFGPEARKYYVQ